MTGNSLVRLRGFAVAVGLAVAFLWTPGGSAVAAGFASIQVPADFSHGCEDPDGFDRNAWHLRMNAFVVKFFRRHLQEGA